MNFLCFCGECSPPGFGNRPEGPQRHEGGPFSTEPPRSAALSSAQADRDFQGLFLVLFF